jgi:regulator of sirC expression with transglutaminase-like and TPR domain
MADALEDFRRLVAAGPALLDCAAQVARYADPHCQPAATVDTVRAWGGQLAARVAADASPLHRLRLLNHFFFDQLGFRANAARYYEAANSHLHCVVERRTGIPITLSLVYMEIGRAAGLKLQGIAFPGHFLVKLPMHDGALVIDVFGGGRPLSADDLRARLAAAASGGEPAPLEAHLRPASEREILARLLRNLKAIHLHAAEFGAALEVQQRLMVLLPESAHERCDRALLFERLECPRAAAEDLAACLAMAPTRADATELRTRLVALRAAAGRLN